MSVEAAYHYLYMGVLIILALLATVMLIRAIIGPRITDRVLSVNMIGTIVISCIAVLSVMLQESYLVDVALIYAMISFLAVVVLTRVYLGVHREHLEARNRRESIVDGFGTDENGEAPAAPAAGGEGGGR